MLWRTYTPPVHAIPEISGTAISLDGWRRYVQTPNVDVDTGRYSEGW